MLENIINLKHFNDLRNSGLALLKDFLSSFFNCSVKMQQVKIEKFEAHFNLDIHTNINRNCYRIDENKIAIVIKVFEEKQGGVIAVMPIVLEGENVCNISNVIFERLAIIISKKMTECHRKSFHDGTKIFGDELAREFIATCLASKQYDYSRILFIYINFLFLFLGCNVYIEAHFQHMLLVLTYFHRNFLICLHLCLLLFYFL